MVVALLLCTSAVTPMPAQKASGFFSTLLLRTVRKSRAEHAHHAGTDDMGAPDEQCDCREQV
jgi:hypothetical protein